MEGPENEKIERLKNEAINEIDRNLQNGLIETSELAKRNEINQLKDFLKELKGKKTGIQENKGIDNRFKKSILAEIDGQILLNEKKLRELEG